jgi:hypothetical protein
MLIWELRRSVQRWLDVGLRRRLLGAMSRPEALVRFRRLGLLSFLALFAVQGHDGRATTLQDALARA